MSVSGWAVPVSASPWQPGGAFLGVGLLAMFSAPDAALANPAAELIDVGKRPGRSTPQDMISALLVELGRVHECVVRLKGGHPYVFGRGGEEALALAEAGVACEVVPGVSSAFAAAAAAGIPVTHRGVTPAVTVVTGHRMDGQTVVDWAALACAGSTLVVLMGMAERVTIADGLIAGGLSPEVPVAIVERATRADQRVVKGRLADLPTLPASAPAAIIIGEVTQIPAAAYRVAREVAPIDVTGLPRLNVSR